MEPKELNELVALDPNCFDDTIRVETRTEPEIRRAMKQLLTKH